MRKKPIQKPPTQPVMVGSVTSTLMTELGMLTRELAERRVLAEDLAAFFALNPRTSEAFGEFQYQREKARQSPAGA